MTGPPASPSRRRPWLIIAVVVGVLAAGVIAAIVWWPRGEDASAAGNEAGEPAGTRYREVQELCTEADLGAVRARFPKLEKPENMRFKFPDVYEATCLADLVSDTGESLLLSLEIAVTGDRSARPQFDEEKAEVTGKKITVTEVTGVGETAFQYEESDLLKSRTLVVLDGNLHLSVKLTDGPVSVEDLSAIATATMAKIRL